MSSKHPLLLLVLGVVSYSALTAPVQAAPIAQVPRTSNQPPEAVMNKFYNYLQKYSLWLGDDRGACSYAIDPTAVKKDGDDRFFLVKLSRGRVGTACRGVLAFRIMQVDCKTKALYEFVREQKEDMRFAGWERREVTLYDPNTRANDRSKAQSAEAVKAICAL